MYIKKITIKNFQSYYDEHVIELSNGVNIFHGSNDSGKSKLFNVFNWGFFNRIYGRDQDGIKDWHYNLDTYGAKICNHYALSKIDRNETIKMSVDIVFCSKIPKDGDSGKFSLPPKAYEKEVDYHLTRSISFKLNTEKELSSKIESWSVNKEELELYFKFLGETFYINNPNMEIGKIFPFEIRDYMWFQGESIEDLVDFKDSNKLRDAINKISYFPVYEKLTDLIKDSVKLVDDQIIKKKRKNQKNSNTYNTISSDIDKFKRYLENEEHENKELNSKIESIKLEINKLKSKLRTINEYPKYFELETKYKSEYDTALKFTEKLDSQRKEHIIRKWMMKGVNIYKPDIEKILRDYETKLISNSPSNNPLPLLIPGEEWINKMIADCMCHVCERPYDKNIDVSVHEALLSRSSKKNEKKNEESKQLNYFYTEIIEKSEEVMLRNSSIDKEIKDFNKKVIEEWDKVQTARNSLDDIKQKIKDKFGTSSISGEAKNANELLNKSEVFEENLKKKQRNLLNSDNLLVQYKNELRELKLDLDKNEMPSAVKLKEETNLKYFKFLESSLINLQEEAFKNLLIDIENKANQLYKNYLSHRSTDGGSLVINKKTLELSNFTKEGIVRDSNQSNEDIAKISVINSILSLNAEKTGIHFPFITDAPSSSFDIETTIAYTSALPDLFKQCIIISKDFDKESIESLKNSKDINSIFKLEYGPVHDALDKIQENSTTIIRKIK